MWNLCSHSQFGASWEIARPIPPNFEKTNNQVLCVVYQGSVFSWVNCSPFQNVVNPLWERTVSPNLLSNTHFPSWSSQTVSTPSNFPWILSLSYRYLPSDWSIPAYSILIVSAAAPYPWLFLPLWQSVCLSLVQERQSSIRSIWLYPSVLR